MSGKGSSSTQQSDLVDAAKLHRKHIPKVIRHHFIHEKLEKQKSYVTEKKIDIIGERSPNSEILPRGSGILLSVCLFASAFYLHRHTNMFHGSSNIYRRRDYHSPSSAKSRQNFTYEKVHNRNGSFQPPHRRGQLPQWEVDLVRRHMNTLGMNSSAFDRDLSPSAICAKVVKKSYLKASLRTHPDVLSCDASEWERKVMVTKFQEVSLAFEELSGIANRI